MGCCCGTLARIDTEIEIQAPVAEVWRVFTDFEDHASWNTFCEIRGDIKVGNIINMLVIKKSMKFKPLVLTFDGTSPIRKEFRWVGNLGAPGLFDGEHFFIFETVAGDSSKTRFIHGEKFSGCLTLTLLCLIESLLLKETRNGFVELNEALKAKIEGHT